MKAATIDDSLRQTGGYPHRYGRVARALFACGASIALASSLSDLQPIHHKSARLL